MRVVSDIFIHRHFGKTGRAQTTMYYIYLCMSVLFEWVAYIFNPLEKYWGDNIICEHLKLQHHHHELNLSSLPHISFSHTQTHISQKYIDTTKYYSEASFTASEWHTRKRAAFDSVFLYSLFLTSLSLFMDR